MWIPDIRPNTGLLVGAAVALTAALPVQAADNFALGMCQVSKPGSGAEIRPVVDGGIYLFDYHGDDPRYKEKLSTGQFFSGAKITLIKAPKHGEISVEEGPWSRETDYHYTPNEGYVGKDRFVMQVEKDGVKVRIHYLMENVAKDQPTNAIGADGERHDIYCHPESWKISLPTTPLAPSTLQSLLTALGIALRDANSGTTRVGAVAPAPTFTVSSRSFPI